MNLSRNKRFWDFLSSSFSSILFSSLLVFLHLVSNSHPVSFPFVFDLSFSWLPVFQTQFHLPLYHKIFNLFLFWMHALPLYALLLMDFVHLLYLLLSSFFSFTFVSLFLLLFSLSTTSLKDKLKELLQIWKKTCLSIYLFVGHLFHIYLSLHKALWRTRLHIQWELCCPSFLLYFFFL